MEWIYCKDEMPDKSEYEGFTYWPILVAYGDEEVDIATWINYPGGEGDFYWEDSNIRVDNPITNIVYAWMYLDAPLPKNECDLCHKDYIGVPIEVGCTIMCPDCLVKDIYELQEQNESLQEQNEALAKTNSQLIKENERFYSQIALFEEAGNE